MTKRSDSALQGACKDAQSLRSGLHQLGVFTARQRVSATAVAAPSRKAGWGLFASQRGRECDIATRRLAKRCSPVHDKVKGAAQRQGRTCTPTTAAVFFLFTYFLHLPKGVVPPPACEEIGCTLDGAGWQSRPSWHHHGLRAPHKATCQRPPLSDILADSPSQPALASRAA